MANNGTYHSSESDQDLCPITLKPVPADPLDVAFVYDTSAPFSSGEGAKCGHRCTLLPLVRYVQEKPSESAGRDGPKARSKRQSCVGGLACPVCQESPVVAISDGIIPSLLSASESCASPEDAKYSVVAFKHGKQTFWLSVPKGNDGGLWGKISTAQDRIGHVLGMDAGKGLKVLHKGKVLHPESSSSPREISLRLTDITNADISKHKKPSLVVMGTRPQGISSSGGGILSSGLFGLFYWGVATVFRTVQTLIGGLVLFAKTILYLPNEERRDN